MATGTVTITEQVHTSVKKVKFDWTSTTGGAAGDTTTNSYSGEIYRVIFDPSTGSQPSASYDVAVNDSDGYDVLNGLGTDCTNSAADVFGVSTGGVVKAPLSAVSSKLTLAVTNAGDTKAGSVILYIR
jgi:hypothetical protein